MIQLDTPREQRLRERLDIVRDQRDHALERLSLRDRAPIELAVERRKRQQAEVQARLLRVELDKTNRAWRAEKRRRYQLEQLAYGKQRGPVAGRAEPTPTN